MPFPEAIGKDIKDQLVEGKTWEGGLREYFGLQYQGTVLFAAFLHLVGQLEQVCEYLKWARELVTWADNEFQVSRWHHFVASGGRNCRMDFSDDSKADALYYRLPRYG